MSIEPEGEDLRKAVKWVSEQRQSGTTKKLAELVEEACVKFDLSPKDEEFLMKTLKKSPA